MKQILLCLMLPSLMIAQKQKPLSIGDTIPYDVKQYLERYANTPLGDGGIILDFMATTCASCIKALPRFDSLQKQYQTKMQFVLVTYEKKDRVAQFFNKNVIAKKVQLPIITEDSMLKNLFPHTFISHLVWIYKRKVIAITTSEHVIDANIKTVLSGATVHLPEKKDLTNYDYSQPLLSFSQTGTPQYYSGFCPFIPGFIRGYMHTKDTIAGIQRYIFINYSLQQIFLKSYAIPLSYPQQYIQWNANNEQRTTAYCYEASLPLSLTEEQCKQKIRDDIGTYFNLTARTEKRDTTYLIITQSKNITK